MDAAVVGTALFLAGSAGAMTAATFASPTRSNKEEGQETSELDDSRKRSRSAGATDFEEKRKKDARDERRRVSDASSPYHANESMITTPNFSPRDRRESQGSNGSDRDINKIKPWRQVRGDSVDSLGPMSPTTTPAGDAAMIEYGLRTVSPRGQEHEIFSSVSSNSYSPKTLGNGDSNGLKTIHEANEKSPEIKERDSFTKLDELVEVSGLEEAFIYVNGMLNAASPAASRRSSISPKMPPGYTTGILTYTTGSHNITCPFSMLDQFISTYPINTPNHPTHSLNSTFSTSPSTHLTTLPTPLSQPLHQHTLSTHPFVEIDTETGRTVYIETATGNKSFSSPLKVSVSRYCIHLYA